MLTQSRGGAIALALVLSLVFLWRPNIKALVFGSMVLTAAVLMFMTSNYWERIESIGTVAEVERGSISKRRLFVEVGADLFLDNPLFGIGMGNFGSELAKSHPEWADRDKVAHNMYLDVFVENGVIAGLVYLSLLASALFGPIRYDRKNIHTRKSYGIGFLLCDVSVFTYGGRVIPFTGR